MSSLELLDELNLHGALTATGLHLPASVTRDEYEALGALLGQWHEASKWAIGDYLRIGPELFGDEAYQLQESLRISPESRAQYVRVSTAIDPERRRHEEPLTWSHHRNVAHLPPEDQDNWLERAYVNSWNSGEMYAQLHEIPERTWQPDLDDLVAAATAVFSSGVITDSVATVDALALTNLGAALGIVVE